MSELKQAMSEKATVIKPKSSPVKVRPTGFDPKGDYRVFNYDKRHNVFTRINLDKYEPSKKTKGVY